MKENILFLDIDGTLYDYHNDSIPQSAITALHAITDTTEIVIATGRAYYMLDPILPIKDLINNYIVVNGQYIISNNKVIYENPLDVNIVTSLVRDLSTEKIAFGFQGEKTEAISHIDDRIRHTFDRLGLTLPKVNANFFEKNQVYQMWCFGTETDISNIKSRYPTIEFTRWLDVGFDILAKGSSKGLGMEIFLEKTNNRSQRIIAIGDGDNDYEMIKRADIGIAMGNATERVKSVADYVTTNVADNGLLNALKYYKLF